MVVSSNRFNTGDIVTIGVRTTVLPRWIQSHHEEIDVTLNKRIIDLRVIQMIIPALFGSIYETPKGGLSRSGDSSCQLGDYLTIFLLLPCLT